MIFPGSIHIFFCFPSRGHPVRAFQKMQTPIELGDRDSSIYTRERDQPDNTEPKSDVESQPVRDNDSSRTATTIEKEAAKDPNLVDWDGPDDPANPMNWPSAKKVTAIGIVSLITMLS